MSNPQTPELPVNALIGLGARPIELRSPLAFLNDPDRAAFIAGLSLVTTSALAAALLAKLDASAVDVDGTLAANSDGRVPSQKAVKTFVAAAIAALVNSAPSILDTLGEIATALQSDESTAAALATTVAGKLAKASDLSDLANAGTARTNLGLGSVTNDAQLKVADLDTDGTLAADSDTKIASQKAVKTYVDAHAGGGGGSVPTGTIVAFGATVAPAGWTLCDGRDVLRADFADLFTVIGGLFGNGNGSTTFTLPDLRGRVLVGVTGFGTFNSIGVTAGEETHTLNIGEIPSHTHQSNVNTDNSVVTCDTGGGDSGTANVLGQSAFSNPDTGATGGSGAHNNIQPSLVVSYIIKT